MSHNACPHESCVSIRHITYWMPVVPPACSAAIAIFEEGAASSDDDDQVEVVRGRQALPGLESAAGPGMTRGALGSSSGREGHNGVLVRDILQAEAELKVSIGWG